MTYIDKLKDNPKLRYYFKRVFHLDSEKIEKILVDQDYKCLICKDDISNKFVVDHDHSCCPPEPNTKSRTRDTCGQCIRGFLCGSCNRALGLFKEDIDILYKAIDYLARYESAKKVKSSAVEEALSLSTKRIDMEWTRAQYGK